MAKEDWEELLSQVSRFLDPSCHCDRVFATFARELVHSPTFGHATQEVLARAECMGIDSPADALDTWREKTGALLSKFCCEPDQEVVEILLAGPYRPGIDPPFEWFRSCCDDCYATFHLALERQRYLHASSAFDAWNLFEQDNSLASVIRELELEKEVRFTESSNGFEACLRAYRISQEGIPKKPGRLDGETTLRLSVHSVAAARLMNAFRYTADIPEARKMLGEVEKLMPVCLPFHRAEVCGSIGVLRTYLGDTEAGLDGIRTATRSLNGVDRHLTGLWKVQLAIASTDSGIDSFFSILQEGMGLVDERRDPVLYQMSAINLGTMLTSKGQPAEALRIIGDIDFVNRHFAATGAAAKAAAFMHLGDHDLAYDWICQSIAEYSTLDRQADAAYCLLLKGEIQQRRGLLANSIEDFATAIQTFEALCYSKLKNGALQDLQKAIEANDTCNAANFSMRLREQLELRPKVDSKGNINPKG